MFIQGGWFSIDLILRSGVSDLAKVDDNIDIGIISIIHTPTCTYIAALNTGPGSLDLINNGRNPSCQYCSHTFKHVANNRV